MPLKGDLRNIDHLRNAIKRQPITLAQDAAKRAAPPITTDTRSSFRSGRTVYGVQRPLGKDGEPLDLVKSGATSRQLGFVAIGTQLRASLGPRYARYLIGKYEILPNKSIPQDWRPKIKAQVDRAFQSYVERVKGGGT